MWLVDHPVFAPTACLCGNQTGPMVDTGMEKYGDRIYVCERCGGDIARKFDYVGADQHDRLHELLAEQEQLLARLNEELEIERRPESKLFTAKDIPEVVGQLYDFIEEKKKRRPKPKNTSAA